MRKLYIFKMGAVFYPPALFRGTPKGVAKMAIEQLEENLILKWGERSLTRKEDIERQLQNNEIAIVEAIVVGNEEKVVRGVIEPFTEPKETVEVIPYGFAEKPEIEL